MISFPIAKIGAWLRVPGLALAVFLGLMKIASLPCGTLAGCDTVLASRYGMILGIPTGFLGALLWLIALLASNAHARRLSLALLALGSIGFVALQIFVLHAFCPWCLAHALVTWAAYPAWRTRIHWSAVVLALVVAFSGHALHRSIATHPGALTQAVQFDQLRASGLAWLGENSADSTVLVLSIHCPSCWERWLTPLATRAWQPRKDAPQLLWKTDDSDREATTLLLAAVLSEPGPPSDAFARVLSLIAPQRELFLNSPQDALNWLKLTFPNAPASSARAQALLEAQTRALKTAGIASTPVLLQRDLPPVLSSSFEDDFMERK